MLIEIATLEITHNDDCDAENLPCPEITAKNSSKDDNDKH